MGRIGGLIPRAALLCLAAVILGGCQYLFGYGDPYPVEPDPSFPIDSFGPAATYTSGRATVKVGADPVVDLPELTEGGTFTDEIGANATFRNAKGWYVRIFGITKGDRSVESFLTIERIIDGQHWTTGDPTGCTFSVEKGDATGLSGTATCKGMRWMDAMSAGSGTEPPYIKGQAPFDAVITFEAAPATSPASGAPPSTQPG